MTRSIKGGKDFKFFIIDELGDITFEIKDVKNVNYRARRDQEMPSKTKGKTVNEWHHGIDPGMYRDEFFAGVDDVTDSMKEKCTVPVCERCGVDLETVHHAPFSDSKLCPRCLRIQEQETIKISVSSTSEDTTLNFDSDRLERTLRLGVALKLNRKELEVLVQHGAEVLKRASLFNSDALPSRTSLVMACDREWEKNKSGQKNIPGFRRFISALTILRQYVAWLPQQHRDGAERDLKFIEARLEELALLRQLVRTLKEFRGRLMLHTVSAEMFGMVQSCAQQIAMVVGVDLWDDNDPSRWGPNG